MIKTARILLGPAGPDSTMQDAATALLAQIGLTLADIWLKSDDYSTSTHFGNWVLVPVRDLPQLANLPPMPGEGQRVDLQREIIEAADILALPIGARVSLYHEGAFGGWMEDEGRVTRTGYRQEYTQPIPYVTIVAKGKRKLGWEIRTGDYARISPLETFHA